ncbi:MAG: ACT domain-containing protein [Propionibacteriaceae bacterium]|nr:ACT domain-containing protein [Propionibacteriaceae bacterium]
MYLVRIQLPDRPGSLGHVATAIGAAGGDIEAVEIVERGNGYAINHFMVELAADTPTDALVSACSEIEGVEVQWVSRHLGAWGIESDIETLDKMSSDPGRAREILIDSAPRTFYCQWAVLLSPDATTLGASDLAPQLSQEAAQRLLVTAPSRAELPAEWLPGWVETAIAAVPLADGCVMVIGRSGGPWFLDSELNRLKHLASLSG